MSHLHKKFLKAWHVKRDCRVTVCIDKVELGKHLEKTSPELYNDIIKSQNNFFNILRAENIWSDPLNPHHIYYASDTNQVLCDFGLNEGKISQYVPANTRAQKALGLLKLKKVLRVGQMGNGNKIWIIREFNNRI